MMRLNSAPAITGGGPSLFRLLGRRESLLAQQRRQLLSGLAEPKPARLPRPWVHLRISPFTGLFAMTPDLTRRPSA